MRAVLFVLSAVAISGCLQADDFPNADDAAAANPDATPLEVATCLSRAHQFKTQIDAGEHYIQAPNNGASWSGKYWELTWSANPHDLVALAVSATWTTSPGAPDLRLGIRNPDPRSFATHWLYGPVNGRSPLGLEFDAPNPLELGEVLMLDLGTSQTGVFGTPATIAILPMEVSLIVQETYRR